MNNSLHSIKERDLWLDNAKGFLMITVVVGHLITGVVNIYGVFAFLSNYIYFFHMPVFAFISGYLMKGRVQRKDYISVINKTLVPYLVAQVLIYLFGVILPQGISFLSVQRLNKSGFSFLYPIYHLWYFLGIIAAFIFCIVAKSDKHPVRAFIIAVAISLVSGFAPTVDFLRLTKVLAFLPFFVLGNIMPKQRVEFVKNKKLLAIPGFIIAAIPAWYLWEIRKQGSLKGIFAMNARFDDGLFELTSFQAFWVRFGFIAAAILMIFAILSLTPRCKTPFAFLGKNSLYVYILHVVPVAVIRHINFETGFFYDMDTALWRFLFVMIGFAISFALASKPIVKLFRPLFEPKFDIRKIGEYLKIEK